MASAEEARPTVGPVQPGATIDERRAHAWIGKSLVVEGRIVSSQDLTIDGKVQGTIELGQHALTIGREGDVTANLAARVVVISGAVTGNVTASAKVELHATGSVDGDIVAPIVSVAEGAVIKGRLDVDGSRAAREPAADRRP
jgi:cytoskeletal protein CcmA (bactofilin family)